MKLGRMEFEILNVKEEEGFFGPSYILTLKNTETGETTTMPIPKISFIERDIHSLIDSLIGKDVSGYRLIIEAEKKQIEEDKIEIWASIFLVTPKGEKILLMKLQRGEVYDFNQITMAMMNTGYTGEKLVDMVFNTLIKVHKTLFGNHAIIPPIGEKMRFEVLLDSNGEESKYLVWDMHGVTLVTVNEGMNIHFPVQVIYREHGDDYYRDEFFERVFGLEDILLIAERFPDILLGLYQEILRYRDRFEEGIETLQRVMECLDKAGEVE
jgi:hypothetical protein